ncbi:MAG: alpha-amylase family glycosyl hydrolase, partial [Cyanobacteria bacterium P01_H01_bin.153]
MDFSARIQPLLAKVYPPEQVETLIPQLYELLQPHLQKTSRENWRKWSHDNILLITYGDSLISDDSRPPLTVLADFLETHLKESVTGVHILPFFPYTSDDGFAIKDYTTVSEELGDWEDVKRISQSFNLMVDLVINHVSGEHPWVKQLQAGEKPGCDYFIQSEPGDDSLSSVVRPRSSSLLTQLETVDGPKHIWSTFSNDQLDVNFANPDVLLEYVKIILFY